jgi:hypothetical protein
MINLHISKLRELLEESYEAGWCGCKELKEDAVARIIDKHFPQQDPPLRNTDYSQLTLGCVDTILVDGTFSTTTSF